MDLSRLKLYAPFIETLEISRCPARRYRIQGNWRARLQDCKSQIYLPNLRRLTYTGPDSIYRQEQLDWVTMFISRSVIELEIGGIDTGEQCPRWQSLSSASRLLRHISETCPGLQNLRIYPGEVAQGPNNSNGFTIQELSFSNMWAPIYGHIDILYNLRCLVISPSVLHPNVFSSISRLPMLETLRIQSSGCEAPVYEYHLSDSSFPALRYLELKDLDSNALAHLCSLAPLVQRLTKVDVYSPQDGGDTIWESAEDRIESTLYMLCWLSSQLADLTFSAGWYDGGLTLSHRLVTMIQRLPLRRLDLGHLVVPPQPGWANLFYTALPLLEELHLEDQDLSTEELRLFAENLPKLRFLKIENVEFRDFGDTPEMFEKAIPQSQIPLRLYTDFTSYDTHTSPYTIARCVIKARCNYRFIYDVVYRFLHALWPNIVIEAMRPGQTMKLVGMENFELINERISALRASSIG